MLKDKIFIILFVLAIATRFFYFNFPGEVVFDEVHFGKFVRSYFTQENYFDIHPPLGKLLIAGTAKIGEFKITDDFNQIGQNYDQNNLLVLRFLPTLISILFIPLIYLFAFELTNSRRASFFSAFLILFDNAILTQSRFGLLDIFLLFFSILAIYFYILQEKTNLTKQKVWFLIFSGLSLGISYSIKWTGLATIPLIGIIAFYYLFKNRAYKTFFISLFIVYLTSLIIYISGFAIHFAILTKPGSGDAYFSPDFKKQAFTEKFIEINKKMLLHNIGIKKDHPYASTPKEWPFNQKPIFYWQKEKTEEKKQELNTKLENIKNQLILNQQSALSVEKEIKIIQKDISNWTNKQQIWLIGNPVVWFLGLISIISGIILILIRLMTKKIKSFNLIPPLFLIFAWAINFLPFILITRPLFLYHYFLPLTFSLTLSGFILNYFIEMSSTNDKNCKKFITLGLLTFIVIGFLVIAPLTYGLNFSPDGLYQRIINYLI